MIKAFLSFTNRVDYDEQELCSELLLHVPEYGDYLQMMQHFSEHEPESVTDSLSAT